MTEDEEFLEVMREAMLAPLDEKFVPCCELFGKTLHHHWGIPKDSNP